METKNAVPQRKLAKVLVVTVAEFGELKMMSMTRNHVGDRNKTCRLETASADRIFVSEVRLRVTNHGT